MRIEWNKVTKTSQAVAILLALAIFGIGFALGDQHGRDSVEILHY